MHKETIASATSGAASGVGITNSVWLWLTADPAAHTITILTVLLIASQLFWGWRKFFKGGA
ncbi:hypothetical protein [Burkholderia orbicola]|uniref:hypothetical protein n=1 Tax=Burkholderia orbicola TaxID=2978683 RepID=UPI002650A165|nr:hypothetical protein [Burkholderia orbicola]MDN7558233.1 hypothetical protein [Burkholderia orbicola]